VRARSTVTGAERERARDLPLLDTVRGLTAQADFFAPRPADLPGR
jgi:hypothetical protein